MRYKPMLAHPVGGFERITEEDWQEGLYSQPKLDGVRCLIQNEKREGYEVVTAYSRTGKEWKNINHILGQLRPFFDKFPEVVLDGELYNHDLRDNFEKIISLVRKTKPTDEDRVESAEKVQFHCYDIVNEDWNFFDRSLDVLSAKIVARLAQLKQLTNWLDTSRYMTEVDWEYLDTTEEEELLSELAKLMTLMNLFTEKEEYEKCSLLKTRIRDIKRKLKEYKDDEI